ncbi:MAG: PAS domain-containing protein [Gemmatimonadaceae bacterium]|nr:PAS domain-containing protein [Gemmatimonadaceae bacterium]
MSPRRTTGRAIAYHAGDIPASLLTLSEIAASLATAESLDDVLPGILEHVCTALGGDECVVWTYTHENLDRAWVHGTPTTSARDAKRLDASAEVPGILGVRLLAGHQPIGLLTLRVARTLSPENGTFFATVADMLGPAIGHAEYARRLKSEVAERTAQIETHRRLLAKIVDSLPLGLYVIDRDYRIQAWNRKRETGTLGVAREEAVGRSIFEILHRQSAEMLRSEFEEVFATGRLQQFTVETGSATGLRTYRLSKIPMRLDDGEVTHAITIGEDITEWREAQDRIAQAEKLAAVGTLAAGVMHEINNPLATIAAAAEATMMRAVDEAARLGEFGAELKDVLALIEAECHRCKRIVDSLLDLSRPKPATKAAVDLNAVIDRVLFLLKHHSRFKKLTVALALDRTAGTVVTADEEQLVQVFMALLLNAVDAMHEQGTVTLRTRADATEVIAEVIDEGEGIRRADVPKLFDPFYTTKPPGRGTGLGLAICYSIVAAHGGRIEVDSAPGEGSVFRILLPRTTTA